MNHSEQTPPQNPAGEPPASEPSSAGAAGDPTAPPTTAPPAPENADPSPPDDSPTADAPPGGSLQGLLPTILTALAVVVLSVLAYRQLSTWALPARWFGIAMIALYVLWLLGEGKVMAREAGQKKTDRDQGTYELYALGRACTLLTALGLPGQFGPANNLVPLGIGLGLLVIGVAFRWWAIHTLGRFYSHFVRQQVGHQIVQSGPYRVLRHPAYTGMLVANVGFVLCFFNWIALGALLGFFLPAVARRIVVEEKTLFQIEGYPEFAAKRWRLFPPLW